MTTETGTITATHLTYATAVTELLSNGDFEMGELSPWTTLYATTIVATTYKSDLNGGDYGCYFECNAGDVGGIIQTFSTIAESVHSISFDYISDIGVIVGLNGLDITTADATDTWTTFSTSGPFLSEEDPITNVENCHLYTGRGRYVEVDNISFMGVITTENISSATIEDSSKSWTADQFNTDGTFILTSGDVKGYSCKILDTFENYIQVSTTFANIINNITVSTTYYSATEQLTNYSFETGNYTGWEIDDFATTTETKFSTGGITSATKYVGSYGFWYDAWCDGYPDWTGFVLSATITDITEIMKITYWYNIPNIQNGAELGTYFKVRAATAGDGEGNFVEVENYHTSVTDGWVQGELDVGTLTGEANLSFSANVPLPDW